MTLCPIALAVGCRKCPVFAVCPATRLIGDQPPKAEGPSEPSKPPPKQAKRRIR